MLFVVTQKFAQTSKSQNIINTIARPQNIDHKEVENNFKSYLSKRKILHKDTILADFNINLLDFDANKKV